MQSLRPATSVGKLDEKRNKDKVIALLDKEIKNSKQKKAMLKKELLDLQNKLQHILDPDAAEKMKMELEYLDEMIKGLVNDINKMKSQQKSYQRYDFIQKDVEIERKLVQIEDERNRCKIQIDRLLQLEKKNHERYDTVQRRILTAIEEHKRL